MSLPAQSPAPVLGHTSQHFQTSFNVIFTTSRFYEATCFQLTQCTQRDTAPSAITEEQ